jgi:hypothetical protein
VEHKVALMLMHFPQPLSVLEARSVALAHGEHNKLDRSAAREMESVDASGMDIAQQSANEDAALALRA